MPGDIDLLPLISRWIHIGSAVVAVGGTVFLRYVLHPVSSTKLSGEAHDTLRDGVVRRWRMVLWSSIALLALSGLYNMTLILPTVEEPMPYHPLFGVKLLLAVVIFAVAFALLSPGALGERFRRRAAMWLTLNVVLAGLVVFLSNMLKLLSSTLGG